MVPFSDRKIWWIASYPKSGSTWVRMFLDAYATGYPVDFYNAFKYVLADIEPSVVQATAVKPLNQLTTYEQFMYYPGVIMNTLNLAKTKDVCIKTHNAKCIVEGVSIIPAKVTAAAIYIIRDPRDVAISYAKHLGTTINGAIQVMNEQGSSGIQKESGLLHIMLTWSEHVKSWTLKNKDVKVIVIRYEDLLKETEEAFKKILAGLCIEFKQDRFDFALQQSSFKHLKQLEEKTGFPEKSQASSDPFFRCGKAEQWKRILTKQQIELIEETHGHVMEEFGYEMSLVPV